MSYTTSEARDLAATQSGLDVPEHDTDRAAYFARLGFGVFPMPTNKKMPRAKGWPDLAMTTVEEVEEMWRSFTPSGWQNIALTLDGWTVVDVDPKNGGTASLEKLTAEYELPVTRTHHTASGPDSLHFIYRADPDRPIKSGPLSSRYPGIDIKTGRGSLIVAPGSVINGRRYEVVSAAEPAVAPSWLSEIRGRPVPGGALCALPYPVPGLRWPLPRGHPGGAARPAAGRPRPWERLADPGRRTPRPQPHRPRLLPP